MSDVLRREVFVDKFERGTHGDVIFYDVNGHPQKTPSTAPFVEIETIDPATIDKVQDVVDIVQSSGRVTGGEVIDNGDGTIDVNPGTGFIRIVNDNIGPTKAFDWPASATPLALTDDATNWVYIDYNGGSPVPAVTDDHTTVDQNTEFAIAMIYREGVTLHIYEKGQNAYNHSMRGHRYFEEVQGFQRGDGLNVTESGPPSLKIVMTAGSLFRGYNMSNMTAIDTAGTDMFTTVYRDGGGGWTYTAAQTTISNTNYDDGTGVLNTITPNQYGIFWVYLHFDNHIYVQYGQDDYKLVDIPSALVPTPPRLVGDFGMLIGRIVVKRAGATFTSIAYPWDTTFVPTLATAHTDLSDMPSAVNADHDGRYYTEAELDGGQLDTRYYTETEIGSVLNAEGASLVGIEDVGGYLAATDMEAALVEVITGVGIVDHGNLAGLADDDHAGHPWLLGRAGDQELHGGTAATEDLYLNSTSHATKGIVGLEKLIGRNVWMLQTDLTNDRITIRNTADGNVHILFGAAAGEETVFNEDGIDTDFRVKGDTDAHLIFADAGLDKVGIGIPIPNEILTVDGFLSLAEQATPAIGGTAGFRKIFYGSDNRFWGIDDTHNLHELGILDGEVFLGKDLADDAEGSLKWVSSPTAHGGETGLAIVTADSTYAFTFGANYGCTDAHGRWTWMAMRTPDPIFEQAEVSIGVPTKVWGGAATIRARIKVNDVDYLDEFYLWWNDVDENNVLVTRGRTDVLASMVSDEWYEAIWNVTLPTVGANGGFRFGVWPVGRDIPAPGPTIEGVQVSVEYLAIRQRAV